MLSNRCVSENQDSEGRFDSTNFSEGCPFRKVGVIEPFAFSENQDIEEPFDRPKFFEGCCFRKLGAIDVLRLP